MGTKMRPSTGEFGYIERSIRYKEFLYKVKALHGYAAPLFTCNLQIYMNLTYYNFFLLPF